MSEPIVRYRVMILDDKVGASAWGVSTRQDVIDAGYEANHVTTINSAIEEIRRQYYDILVVDMDLGGTADGVEFQRQIRAIGLTQPIIFVTGNRQYLDRRIFEFTDAFRRGAVLFYDKLSDIDLIELIKESTAFVDPLRRSLYMMQKAGLGQTGFTIDGHHYTIDQLLVPNDAVTELVKNLREALQALMVEVRLEEMNE